MDKNLILEIWDYFTELSETDRHRLFEGIIIGIYGNWLISLIEKNFFTELLVIGTLIVSWLQPFLIILSS